MRHTKWFTLFLCSALSVSVLTGCGNTAETPSASGDSQPAVTVTTQDSGALVLAEQGMFSAGGDQSIDTTVIAQAVAATIDEVYARTGNDHFLFQDLNNDVIADHVENWIQENVENIK